ncbi:MAG TPA: hypothetical protein VJ840_17835 [Gemmatimonadaceae bacterium]|nr:hypothetical protein [Gemmatimonadaceae bacterium]
MLTRSDGVPLANVPVQWTVTAGGGYFVSPAAQTNAAGHAVGQFVLGPSGDQSVDVAVPRYGLHTTFSATIVNPTRTAALHYDGSAWTPVFQDATGALPVGYAVWGTSPSEVFFAGSSCGLAVVLRSNGGSWTQPPCSPPPTASISYWGSLSGTSSADMYATIVKPSPGTIAVYHATSPQSWIPVYSPHTGGMNSVWAKSPTNVFAVGSATIVHYDGSGWSESAAPVGGLNAVWADPTSNAAFAVGSGGGIAYFDGATWRQLSSGTTETLNDVWGTSSSDVFVVGTHGTILHYNGIAWSPQASGTTQTLNAIWGSSANSVFAVGDDIIEHYDGSAWTRQTTSVPMLLHGVWGTSSNDVYAVGEGPIR